MKNYTLVRRIKLSEFELRVLIHTLNDYRLDQKARGEDTTDVNNLILKCIDILEQ